MLNHTWKDSYIALEQRQDELARAELRRELHAIQLLEQKNSGLANLMVTLGGTLQVWGCRIQARYERVLRQQQASAMGASFQLLGDGSIQHNC
jgi:hypothetical protein